MVEEEVKQQLKEQYEKLNPAELKRRIDRLQEKLGKLYLKKQRENAITDRYLVYPILKMKLT